MSMIWVVAGVLTLLAVAALVYPLLRARSESPRYLAVIVTALGVPGLALGMYFVIGEWRTPELPAAGAQQDLGVMIQQLDRRLRQQGGTLDEWMMLGKSYTATGRYSEAAQAYKQASEIAGGDNLDVLAFYAEALLLADQNQLLGEGGQIFQRILEARPNDTRGLWYGGLVAFEQSQFDLAVSRWQQLLGQSPPDTLRPILEERIADAQVRAGGIVSPQAAVQAPMPESEESSPQASTRSVIRVSVSADPGLIDSVAPGTPVFVLARSTTPGPPLAARRMSVGDLPFTVELSDDDAMVAGRDISSSSRVEIVARVALGGSPVAQAGDLFGGQELDVTGDISPVQITISERVQ